MVVSSTTGMSHLSNSMPMSRSIQGNAFSWPTATSTSSQAKNWSGSPVGTSLRRLLSSYSARTFSNVMPVSLPLSCTNSLGTRKFRIGMSSCMASSFSQGDAFISSKPERTITFTSSPPRRREERQQSIAVLPPPSTITRLPIFVMWPNETEDSQSMPIWMFAAASWRPGNVQVAPARRAGADEDRVVVLGQQRLQAVDPLAQPHLQAKVGDVADLLVDDLLGQAEVGDLAADHAAGAWVEVVDDALVAERGEVARHGQARPGRRRPGRCACRCCAAAVSAGAPVMSPLWSAATRFRRQIATGSFSTRPRRQAGSHGRSQVRPRMPGNTLERQLIM